MDWAVNVNSAAQRAAADDFLTWLLATDVHGNAHANLRRLGIMYVIWDRRVFKAYRAQDGWKPTRAPPRTPTTSTSRCPGPAHAGRPRGGAGFPAPATAAFWPTGAVSAATSRFSARCPHPNSPSPAASPRTSPAGGSTGPPAPGVTRCWAPSWSDTPSWTAPRHRWASPSPTRAGPGTAAPTTSPRAARFVAPGDRRASGVERHGHDVRRQGVGVGGAVLSGRGRAGHEHPWGRAESARLWCRLLVSPGG